MLIGEPGTGKSLIGQALAELLPKEKLVDVLCLPNPKNENNPKIKTVPAGMGKKIVEQSKLKALASVSSTNNWLFILIIFLVIFTASTVLDWIIGKETSDILKAADRISGTMFLITMFIGAFIFYSLYKFQMQRRKIVGPKLLIDNSELTHAPFVDATGLHEGALLGDVLHDPFQCIPGDELVHLPNGAPVKIKEIIDPLFENRNKKEGELVLKKPIEVLGGSDNDYGYTTTSANKVFRRFFDGNLIEIKTRRGITIRVTPNHPLAILNEFGNIVYVRADKISKGMFTILPKKYPITANKVENKDFIRLIADILADGHISKRSVSFKLRKKYKIDLIIEDIKKNNLKPKINRYGKDVVISINSSAFVKKLISIGLYKGGKRIPPMLFDQPKELILEFLIRYISLDGYVGSQGQFELISKELIPYFIPLLLKVGVIANLRCRKDPGFGKGKLQQRIIFSNHDFAKRYYVLTKNPTHRKNLQMYLSKVKGTPHSSYHDLIPISFNLLEKIRNRAGLSKSKVHKEYFALRNGLSSSKSLTRYMLSKVVDSFKAYTNCPDLFKIERISHGTYSYDEILSIKRVKYKGYVYNFTTDTGNYVVNNVLTHNTGGLGTPAHERVVAGAIHKANGGVLFIDEIATLKPEMQVAILTAMQEKKMPITGRSERSAGAMVKTEPVPTDFVLVAAGNLETIKHMHPALRSRIRGSGYEVYMNDKIKDTPENVKKFARFVAQEVKKDGKIPHFTKKAVLEVIKEARRRAGRKGYLSLRLRDLGGLIRVAGDIAKEEGSKYVTEKHVIKAKKKAGTLEQQIAERYTAEKKEYQIIKVKGAEIGRVNGLAVIGGEYGSGILLPIEAAVVPAMEKGKGKILATGKLGEIAKEAITNVSAIFKKYSGKSLSGFDIHIQFLQTYEGIEGDSASISVATAVISALEKIPVKQDVAMTGSLSIRGEVLPIGGVNSKIEAAKEAGIKTVIIPKSNEKDVLVDLKGIKLIAVENIAEVLEHALKWPKGKKKVLNKIKKAISR